MKTGVLCTVLAVMLVPDVALPVWSMVKSFTHLSCIRNSLSIRKLTATSRLLRQFVFYTPSGTFSFKRMFLHPSCVSVFVMAILLPFDIFTAKYCTYLWLEKWKSENSFLDLV